MSNTGSDVAANNANPPQQNNENASKFLTPKILFKFAPEYMKKESSSFLLQDRDIF